jgi:hypothetical protein
MINAKVFRNVKDPGPQGDSRLKMWSAGQNPNFREGNFNTKNGEEGGVEIDRPLIIQVSSRHPMAELADPLGAVLR